jgi:PKD repeat protein
MRILNQTKLPQLSFVFTIILLLTITSPLTWSIESVQSAWIGETTIYIQSDGSVSPSTAPIMTVDNITYTLTDNINLTTPGLRGGIVIERDNIILDGQSYILSLNTGSRRNTPVAVYLDGRRNVTVKQLQVIGNYPYILGGNLDAISLTNCTNIAVIDNRLSGLGGRHGYSLLLTDCHDSIISRNTLKPPSLNEARGCVLSQSHRNIIDNNTIDTGQWPFEIVDSHNNTIQSNNITCTNGVGLLVTTSHNNTIHANLITAHDGQGLNFSSSHENHVTANLVTADFYSMKLRESSNNTFYHNTFVHGNPQSVYIIASNNTWDNGYPSGGNYWSNYIGHDIASGLFQNETGSDGIGDLPHKLWREDAHNYDVYPRIFPLNAPPQPPLAIFSVTPSSDLLGTGDTITFDASAALPGWNGTAVRPIIMYSWDFGDGRNVSVHEPITTHAFTRNGNFTVTLTVIDSHGFNSTYTQPMSIWMSTSLTLKTRSPALDIGSMITVQGKLQDFNRVGIRSHSLVFSYTFEGAESWLPLTSTITDQNGQYSITWQPQATGVFTLKAEWVGNTTHLGTSTTRAVSIIEGEHDTLFLVESNSTIASASYTLSIQELTVKVHGPEGTAGYIDVLLAKTSGTHEPEVNVYLDGDPKEYDLASDGETWRLTVSYQHSTHIITINLSGFAPMFHETLLGQGLILGCVIAALVIGVIAYRKYTNTITS